jgi:excisionase family DNA binding protein
MAMLTVDEFCKRMRISRQHFQRLLVEGEAPEHIRIGDGRVSQLRITEEAVERWIEARTRQAQVRQRELAKSHGRAA